MFIITDDNFFQDIEALNFVEEVPDKKLSYFGPLSKINFFVGANNSGKSTFLRNLLNKTFHKVVPSSQTINNLESLKKAIKENFNRFQPDAIISIKISDVRKTTPYGSFFDDRSPALKDYFNSGNIENIEINKQYFQNIIKSIESLNETSINVFNRSMEYINSQLLVAIELVNDEVRPVYQEYAQRNAITLSLSDRKNLAEYCKEILPLIQYYLANKIIYDYPSERIYIPILRTLTTLFNASKGTDAGKLTTNIYEGTILKNYFKYGELNEIKISTGLDFFQDILFARNNERKIRAGFEAFEKFLSKTFFSGKDVDIIAKQAREDREKHIYLYLDEVEHDIHRFGDGIQACILLLYPIFTAKDGAWIFIEEPELNLHPGFQIILLTTLLNNIDLNKKNLRYFITTHSNHLLDLTLTYQTDLSIFTFRENRSGDKRARQISNVKSSDIDALELLGVNNSSVYLSNCSVWVEGHSDTLFLRAFLKAYEIYSNSPATLKEDLHYSFFEYSGSNVSHYLFSEIDHEDEEDKANIDAIKARFLSNKILLIADRDSMKKGNMLLAEMESKYFTYEALSVREIENLLSPHELRILLPMLHGKLKSLNWESYNLDQNDYQAQYLGDYLKIKLKGKFPEGLRAKSGTINSFYKINLPI
jgi:AAA15 family ATPase/GTPase